jgi:hypothetical protein
MTNTLLINATEVAKELGVSAPCAYKMVKKMNDELKAKGYLTVSGKVSRKYFYEKVYGFSENKKGGENNGGI